MIYIFLGGGANLVPSDGEKKSEAGEKRPKTTEESDRELVNILCRSTTLKFIIK